MQGSAPPKVAERAYNSNRLSGRIIPSFEQGFRQSGECSWRLRARPKPGRLRLALVGPTRRNVPAASVAPSAATTVARPLPRSASLRATLRLWPRPAQVAAPRPASAGSVSPPLPLPQSRTAALQTVSTRPLGLCLRHGWTQRQLMPACLPHSLRREATSDNLSTYSPHTFASKPASSSFEERGSPGAFSASALKVRTYKGLRASSSHQ
jgi:hypothetical protein